jgi:hypothetical protein
MLNPGGTMADIAYTVSVTLPDESMAREWLRWLREGHIAEVLGGGACRAEVVALDQPPHAFEVRYLFPSREAFDRYEREFAPRLRAEGLRLFPVERGVGYQRTSGAVTDRQVSPGSQERMNQEGSMVVTTETHYSSADAAKSMRDVLGPHAVDHMIRHAMSTCWMMLPEDQKTVAVLEREIRRLVDRALKDMREDMAAFSISQPQQSAKKSEKRRGKGS